MMKRILALAALLALLLSMAGCGGALAQKEEEKMDKTPASSADTVPTAAPTPSASADSAPATAAPAPGTASAAEKLAGAVYPEMAPYPSWDSENFSEEWDTWRAGLADLRGDPETYAQGLEPYLRSCLTEFLSEAGDGNRICAPMNIYMALCILAELTDGESRAQVLALLGETDIQALRTRAKAIWDGSYRDDGVVTCRLASSLWLNQYVSYIQDTVDRLAENYYASSFRGEMGTPEYDQALRDWLNAQTGDLLQQQSSGLHMDSRTVLALATTVYFKAPWTNKFSAQNTAPQTFHAPGGDEETDFLHRSFTGTYFWGEGFSAVSLSLEEDGAMWFILPDEGVSPEDLLTGEGMDFLLRRDKYAWERNKTLTVHFAAPRFDVSSDLELSEGLKRLGVTDVFDPGISDFTPMTKETEEIYVSQASHAARVMIDEDGCTGAAYTVIMMAAGAAMPPEESVDFTADRPFIFAVTGQDGLPLFTGIVNTTR